MPATSVSKASVMLSALLVVHTRTSARRLYANTPNRLRGRLFGSAAGAAPKCGEGALWGEGRAAKAVLLHQAQTEWIAVGRTVAHADRGDDDQNDIRDAQYPKQHKTDQHDGQHGES